MKVIVFACVIILAASCKGKQGTVADKQSKDTAHYFEVRPFIQSQIGEVNKTPYFIYRLTILNGIKDSAAINNTAFTELAKQFLQPDINDPSLKKYYTENVFFDQTIKTYTLSYTTANKDLEVQNVDVLLNEDAKTVKRIFIRKFRNYTDSSSVEQLSWKPNQSFQVTRLVQTASPKKETSRQTVVVWNEIPHI